MSSVQFNLRIERALLDDIKRAAEERGMPAAEFIREAVVFRIGYLAAQEDRSPGCDPLSAEEPGRLNRS